MLYRLNFKINGKMLGKIDSNTIFGLFCQAYKIKHGDEDIELLLEMLENSIEDIVFSNPLKVNTLNFLSDSMYEQIAMPLIDRTGYGNNELKSYKADFVTEFDSLLYTTLDVNTFKELFSIMKLLGVGSKKSVGFGSIKDINITEVDINSLTKNKFVHNLSNIIPSEDTTTYGKFDYITRCGKTIEGKNQQPVIMIKSGSTLLNTDKLITGIVLKDNNTNTYINGKSILV